MTKSTGHGRGSALDLELPFSHLIRGIARCETAEEREEAATAYLLALAAQHRTDHPEDRLAVAAMVSRTRRELFPRSFDGTRGALLDRLAGSLIAGSDCDCAVALLELAGWYDERARDPEAKELSGVARELARTRSDGDLRMRAEAQFGWSALRCGSWSDAFDAFRRAAALGRLHGRPEVALRAELGIAGAEIARGRIPNARVRALRAWSRASRLGDLDLLGLCGETLFAVEEAARDFQRALDYAWSTLAACGVATVRGPLLLRCARMLRTLGDPGAARRMIELASCQPLSRRQRFEAEIVLLELDAIDRNEIAFVERRKRLEASRDLAEMPSLRAEFWLVVAGGSRVLGRRRWAKRAAEAAARDAEIQGLDRVLVDAQAELAVSGSHGEGTSDPEVNVRARTSGAEPA